MLRKTAVRTAIGTVLFLLAANAAGVAASNFLDWRSLSMLIVYLAPFVLARYTPGVCLYRMVVLDEPDRHFWPELERARSFALYARKRLLLAGLIFTLMEAARIVLAYQNGGRLAGTFSPWLLAAVYALGLYYFAGRAGRAVAVSQRR